MKTLKKFLTLFCLLLISSILTKSNAQNYSVAYNNTSNCHWVITIYTSGAVPICTENLTGLSSSPSCALITPTTLIASYVEIYNTWTACMVSFPVGPGNLTGITTYCGLQCTVANTTETIDVTWAPATCSGVAYNEITVTITP